MNDKKHLILVVDDSQVVLKTLSLKLQANGYEVATAVDGSEALAAVRRRKPDLVLLDIGFPPEVCGVTWDGFSIIEWFRRNEETKNLPIVIITRGDAEQYKERALAAGAAAFFHKPINNDELLATLQQILSNQTKAEAAGA